MSYKNTGKPNGRPSNLERDLSIVADARAGIPLDVLAKKHGLQRQYLQKIASEYLKKERIKKVEERIRASNNLYSERDQKILKIYSKIKPKGKNNEQRI